MDLITEWTRSFVTGEMDGDVVRLPRSIVTTASSHAMTRWRQYIDDYGDAKMQILESWARAEGVNSHKFDAGEVRYDDEAGVALIKADDVIVTVIPEENLDEGRIAKPLKDP